MHSELGLLWDASILLLGLIGGGFALYRVMTKDCWACQDRMPRLRSVCAHCGRSQMRSRR